MEVIFLGIEIISIGSQIILIKALMDEVSNVTAEITKGKSHILKVPSLQGP